MASDRARLERLEAYHLERARAARLALDMLKADGDERAVAALPGKLRRASKALAEMSTNGTRPARGRPRTVSRDHVLAVIREAGGPIAVKVLKAAFHGQSLRGPVNALVKAKLVKAHGHTSGRTYEYVGP